MRRMKISKFKQVFTPAFIPRVCKGDFRCSPGKFVKLSLDVRKSACRSTSSCSQTENDIKKCQQIIDRVFAPNVPFTEKIFTECNPKTKSIAQIVSSQPLDKESRCEICRKLIKHIFGDGGETSNENAAGVVKPHESPQAETVNATTAKIHEEQLAQKVEIIDETPLVEAHKPKVEGFNLQPKVLGGKDKEEEGEREVGIHFFSKDKYFNDIAEKSANERAAERAMKRETNFDVLVGSIDNEQDIVKLNFSTNKNFNDAGGSVKKGETNYDELAKRCLDSPSGRIDERLLKEMGKLGIPPTSGRDSKKNLNEHEFIQAEIMKKRRKPSEKTDLDLLAIDNKDFAKFNKKIPRIPHSKSIRNSMIACRDKSSKKMTNTYRHISSNELGYMAATGISGDETMKSSSKDSKMLNNKPDIKEINLVDHVSVTIEESVPKVKQLPAKETTPNLETYKYIIQNLIRTRVEHLLHDSIKSFKMEEDNYNIISKTNVQFDDQNHTYVVKSTGSKPEISSNISKEPIKTNNEEIIRERLTEETMDGESKKSLEFANRSNSEGILNTSCSDAMQDIYIHDRVTPTHILSKQDIYSDESSSLPHPGVIIGEFTPTSKEDSQSPSIPKKPERVTPIHILYKQDIYSDESSSLPHPGVIIREFTPTSKEDSQSPSIPKKPERVTPTHILFKQDINSDESSSLPHPGVIIREFVEMNVPPTSKEDSQSPSLLKITAKSDEGMLQEVHTHEDNIGKHDKSALYSKKYKKQYLMKGEPTVYKSNIYHKHVEYIQKAQKPITNRSDIYSPQQPTEEPKPIKVESTEDRNSLDAQYVSFVIKDNKPAEKEPVVDQNTFSGQHNFVQSSQQPRIDGEQKEKQPAVDQSGKYNLQQQQPMEMQPTPTQNYAYNQYTNYMHSVQQPQMDNQNLMPQDNIYNPYNYLPNQTQEVPFVHNQNIDHLQSFTPSSVVENVTPEIKKEKDLDHRIEPVIVAETGRNPLPEKTKPSATVKDPLGNSCILSENLDRPLIGKESLAHLTSQSIQQYPSEQLTPISTETMTLSQLLEKVRERNRIEYCRDTILQMKNATQIKPTEGKCGTKPPTCPPPAPTCPPPKPKCPPPPPPDCPPCPLPPKPPCPPPKPPCPNPCRPKCPPPCKPNPCAPKPQCPPVKKSPCDKFKKCNCSLLQIEDALALLVYYGPQFYIPENVILPKITGIIKNKIKKGISKLQKDCNITFLTMDQVTDMKIDRVMYARTYHPWSPIPSWPVPKKQDKKKVVCPKDGCKQNPPSLNPPCNDINPCLTFPKPNSLSKRSFSIVDNLYLMLTLNLAS